MGTNPPSSFRTRRLFIYRCGLLASLQPQDPRRKNRWYDDASNLSSESEAPRTIKEGYERADLWLEDGNVILVAEKTAFKVHRSILARNSEIFHDLFELPQPVDEETFEGCPIVHLPDSKEDVEYMLAGLCDIKNTYVIPWTETFCS